MWRFEIHDVLTSTLDYCRQRASLNEESGLVVIAHEQSAGRGTRGRKWSGSRDNLALTFLLYGDEEGRFLSSLPFMTALALYDSCMACLASVAREMDVGISPFQLKWPNDLLLNGGKLSGILIESGHNERGQWISVGTGVNLASAPQIEGRRTSFLGEVCHPPHPVIFARILTKMMTKWLTHWQKEGNDVIYKAWLKRAHPVGTRLSIASAHNVMSGLFDGIDSYGRLLLRQDDGMVVSVATGDVFCL
ncbi:biotin--[acetyl-CoA-carboxylase] ligase [Acetobacteraceae bacterium ESL0709]|nr:biotin--[acetyl-CoA-carboxylase] ligase [Acetobacteraceae bacterium ESL0697]MDF7678309.1 biotin--[acetyl-CoA-carboxylase] ligase [Acetobacteraceae bacterium ESL0709]